MDVTGSYVITHTLHFPRFKVGEGGRGKGEGGGGPALQNMKKLLFWYFIIKSRYFSN